MKIFNNSYKFCYLLHSNNKRMLLLKVLFSFSTFPQHQDRAIILMLHHSSCLDVPRHFKCMCNQMMNNIVEICLITHTWQVFCIGECVLLETPLLWTLSSPSVHEKMLLWTFDSQRHKDNSFTDFPIVLCIYIITVILIEFNLMLWFSCCFIRNFIWASLLFLFYWHTIPWCDGQHGCWILLVHSKV